MLNISKNKRFIPSVYKIGYLGIGNNLAISSNKIYVLWKSILQRCYSENKQLKTPTYIGCTVDERWHNFQVFAEWYNQNYIDGWYLDKDILFKGNKIYGPDTCCFVPVEINNLFIKNNKRRNICIGITKRYDKFQVNFKVNGKSEYFGTYNTIDEAFINYKINKESYILDIANKWKEKISDNVYQALINYKVEITD